MAIDSYTYDKQYSIFNKDSEYYKNYKKYLYPVLSKDAISVVEFVNKVEVKLDNKLRQIDNKYRRYHLSNAWECMSISLANHSWIMMKRYDLDSPQVGLKDEINLAVIGGPDTTGRDCYIIFDRHTGELFIYEEDSSKKIYGRPSELIVELAKRRLACLDKDKLLDGYLSDDEEEIKLEMFDKYRSEVLSAIKTITGISL